MIALALSSSHAHAPTSLQTSRLMNAPLTHPNVQKMKNKTIVTYCKKEGPGSSRDSNSEANLSSNLNNIILKAAWYGSEALGIAASLFRPSTNSSEQQKESLGDVTGSIPRDAVVVAIKEDFERSYFVTGNLTMSIYKEDCEFADPAGSFKGLGRFKRNCSNFGSLLKTSGMKLMDWKDFENKGVGYWRFICVLAFPWRPILSATGYTEYHYDTKSGKICRIPNANNRFLYFSTPILWTQIIQIFLHTFLVAFAFPIMSNQLLNDHSSQYEDKSKESSH